MRPSPTLAKKKNLLLAFDAFGTLFTPKAPIAVQYGEVARKHGLRGFSEDDVNASFRAAFKKESKQNPNYGKAVGMDAQKWWTAVIHETFQPFVSKEQKIPSQLYSDLITRFSTKDGYTIYPDVLAFFEMLRSLKNKPNHDHQWKWDKTVVGIITNSDDRVPEVLSSLGLHVGPRRIGTKEERSSEANADDDISFVALSYDVGYEKPDRRIFDAAKEMLGETLSEDGKNPADLSADDFEMLYVGDDMEKDYFGAKAAGWNAVFLDREGRLSEQLPDENDIVSVDVKGKESGQKERCIDAIKDLRALSAWTPK